ncbi:MAG: flagellar motor stator protein MotA [Firmicutes bacterium]|nr:flagellar motor stator protein MotA [Bacillota bacterium]
MEMASVVGLILGLVAVGLGMVLKGASLGALNNPAAFLIIFVGTIASVSIAFPTEELKRVPKLFKLVFVKSKTLSKIEVIKTLIEISTFTRREGLLALDERLEDIEDDFLKRGLQLIVDGTDLDMVKAVLEEEINATEARHNSGSLIFSQAGAYAPTLGVLGAVVGLIAALGNLNDIEKLGHSIAAAFVATLLGIFTGYVLWNPMANKLKRISKREIELKEMMMEGILSMGQGLSPTIIEQYLISFLSLGELDKYYASKEGAKDGQE